MKSVFIALMMSERHHKFIREYLDMIKNFTYPDISLYIAENTPDKGKYFKKLKGICSEYDFVSEVIRYDWNPKEKLCFEMTSDCKNLLVERFLDGKYDLYFSFDADEIIPHNSLEYLIEDDKDNVGFPTPVWSHEPCVLGSGGGVRKNRLGINEDGHHLIKDDGEYLSESGWGLDLYTWHELIAMMRKKGTYLHKVYAVGNGCLLSKRKVMKEVKWKVPRNFVIGEDVIWYENVNLKGFEFWVDMRVIPIHKFVGWETVPTWMRSKNQKIYIASGNVPEKDEKILDNMTQSDIKDSIKEAVKDKRIIA